MKRAFPKLALTGGIFILALGSFAGPAAQPGQWQIEVADFKSSGQSSSLRIDRYGNAHVAYIDAAQNVLKYAFWDSGVHKWFTTAVDRGSGTCSLVLDSKQHPHVSYLDYGTGRLKYAYWDGLVWQKQSIQTPSREISFYNSIALDPNDHPSISFYEYFGMSDDLNLRLRVVSWTGSAWEVRTVDGTAGSGKFNSIATDSSGHAHIAYGNVKYENASLRYAYWNGQSWDVEVPDGAGKPGTSRWSVGLALDKANNPHIACTDVANRLVKYATKKNGEWIIEVVDSLVRVAYPDRYGIAVDDDGTPYISYYDAGLGVLKVAWKKDKKWIREVVDENFAGFTSSLQIYNGTIWVTYDDEAVRTLKCARRPLGPLSAEVQEKRDVQQGTLPASIKK